MFVRRVGGCEEIVFVVELVTVVGEEGGGRREEEDRGGDGGIYTVANLRPAVC